MDEEKRYDLMSGNNQCYQEIERSVALEMLPESHFRRDDGQGLLSPHSELMRTLSNGKGPLE